VRKKRVVIHSTFSKLKTGFARNSKEILKYLYKTGKYDIMEYASGGPSWNDPRCQEMPWKCHGTLPDDKSSLRGIQDPGIIRHIHYGAGNIDKVIKEFKPDVYIGIEDIWAFQGYWDKPWWSKINSVLWTTLDSLPLYPVAVDNADKIKNFWVWASFAEKEMKRLGKNHVKTINGAFDINKFFPLSQEDKLKLRKRFNIDSGAKVFGFVFRNQLRKLVGSLLEGFALYKSENPGENVKILLHTNWNEGWNIQNFIKEFKINPEDILTTHYCSACKGIEVSKFLGAESDCHLCGSKKTLKTPTIADGCTEEQLNYIYNLMDAYIHPMTSGGLEMPIAEAMLAELPVATVPYSCGTEYTENEFVFPISFSTYREVGSNFTKASTHKESIANFISRVVKQEEKYKQYGKDSREWAIKKFSINTIGKQIEEFLDSVEIINEDKIELTFSKRNDSYPMPSIEDNTEWLIDIYKNILNMEESPNTEGVKHWLNRMEAGVSRENIYEFFVGEAKRQNGTSNEMLLNSFFDGDEKKKIVYVMPKSLGDCVLSLNVLKSLRRDYSEKDWNIYVCTEKVNFEIFKPFIGEIIKNLIPYSPSLDNYKIWEGSGEHRGVCDIVFMPYGVTQRFENYTHNGEDLNLLQKCIY